VGVLVITLVTTTVKAPAHAADTGVTWNPGPVNWEILKDGRCITSQSVHVTAKNHEDAVAISNALKGVPAKKDYPADSGILDVHANVGTSINTNDFPVILHAYLPGDKCRTPEQENPPEPTPASNVASDPGGALSSEQVLFDAAGSGRLDAIQLAGSPTWLKAGVGAIVGVALYVAVSALVTAGLAALGVLAGASAATVAAVAALSGCIGGAASSAMMSRLLGSTLDWKATVTNAVTGCLSGAFLALMLPVTAMGAAAGNAILALRAPAAVVGETGVAAAGAAGVELTGITEVTTTTVEAALAAR
jgi:hypothetical protein